MDKNTIEYRIEHPMCIFCKYSRYQFFTVKCDKNAGFRTIPAKTCPNYCPTLESIEKRSLG